jgi:two-component system, response regulator / RNA-binding antiterminator
MSPDRPEPLRVLIANERADRLEATTRAVERLGHVVIARELQVSEVGAMTANSTPDVALVAVGESSDEALGLISRIVQEATCPVIAVLEVEDPAFIREAARRGVFAYLADGEADELESALEIVLERFAEFRNLEGAFGRRAVTERAKGILMERHRVDEQRAFELLRSQSRNTGRKLVEVAEAVVGGYLLLPARERELAQEERETPST